MNLADRLAARGLGADYKPTRGAEAFMAGELDDAHLLAEHRAACDELVRLRAEVKELRMANGVLRIGYRDRTDDLMRVMAERDALLAEKGIEHHGSDAT